MTLTTTRTRVVRARLPEGQTLIGILVVLVIILVGYGLFIGPRKTRQGTQKSVAKAAIDKATDLDCQNNLSQLRQAIAMYGSGADEKERPPSLADLGKSMEVVEKCPVGGEPYQYDPATGKVWCVHPGHEKF